MDNIFTLIYEILFYLHVLLSNKTLDVEMLKRKLSECERIRVVTYSDVSDGLQPAFEELQQAIKNVMFNLSLLIILAIVLFSL